MLSGCMSHNDAMLNAKLLEVEKLYDNGQYNEAKKICVEEILVKDPYNEDAIKSLDKIYQKLHDMAEQKRQRIENSDDASEWSHIPGNYFVDKNHVINKWGK